MSIRLSLIRRTVIIFVCVASAIVWINVPVLAQTFQLNDGKFAGEPEAHKLYDQMIAAMRKAQSLSYESRYETQGADKRKIACSYQVWLKKPNYFRMQIQSSSGEKGGILIGDGTRLWIFWPNGRPEWANIKETQADQENRFTSYMTKPTPIGKHSILHEAVFLGSGMVFPILDASTFHGHVDSVDRHLDAVRHLGLEMVGGEECDKIEVGLAGFQRTRMLWIAKRDQLPRKLKEVVRLSYDHITHEEWMSVAIDSTIPDSLFEWTPPKNWVQWQLPTEDGSLIKPGALAPDFELTSMAGELSRPAEELLWNLV
jgi:outer membrane lipoprotein-sorting protein